MSILNYFFIGFSITFLLDCISYLYRNHESFQKVPKWNWKARIMFTLFWPLGAILFVYTYIKSLSN